MTDFFKDIPEIKYEGPNSTNEYAFRYPLLDLSIATLD